MPARGLGGGSFFGQAAKSNRHQDHNRQQTHAISCAVSLCSRSISSRSLCARAARARLTIESKAFDPKASGFSIAESNASDMVIASNCRSVAIFLLSGNAPNFFRNSASVSTWCCASRLRPRSDHHDYFTVVLDLHLTSEAQRLVQLLHAKLFLFGKAWLRK